MSEQIEKTASLFGDSGLRKQIYSYLHRHLTETHRELLLALLKQEMLEREEDSYEDFELFYWCIFLLYRIRRVEDSLLIWRAKQLDFDASIGVEGNFLIGAGLEQTKEYLKTLQTDEACAFLSYLEEGCREKWKEIVDEDYQKEWFAFRMRYFDPKENSDKTAPKA